MCNPGELNTSGVQAANCRELSRPLEMESPGRGGGFKMCNLNEQGIGN